jgi:DNA polymerase-1
VHADLDPLGTSTGRFSCRDPNLQALPSPLLAAVVASPGNVLLEVDFSQCELRILAHFSRDARLLHAYQADGDLHRQTAAAVLRIPPHRVTAKDRQRYGKQINFAVIYGMTAEGLAQNVGLTVVEAQAMLDAYFIAYPGVRQWINQVHTFVQAHGHVRTLYQRRRQLPAIWSAAPQEIAEAQRQAVNTIIQGTAADLMKLALIRLHERLPVVARLLLTVHDSVLLEVPEHLVEQTKRDVVDAMQVIPPGFRVPLKVDCGVGRTWVECKMSH